MIPQTPSSPATKTTKDTKEKHLISPTDVTSFRHSKQHNIDNSFEMDEEEHEYNSSLARLGDLPIVREGSILDDQDDNQILMNDESYDDTDDDIVEGDEDFDADEDMMRTHYMEYEQEQEDLRREMNINKIAFASYRGAVLHLVHNQVSFPQKNTKKSEKSDDANEIAQNDPIKEVEKEEKSIDGESVDNVHECGISFSQSKSFDDTSTVNTEDEANERMTLLEELAKEIIETKARACFEALDIALEFEERRAEKRQRQRMLIGGLAGVGGQDNMLAELRKIKNRAALKSGKSNIETHGQEDQKDQNVDDNKKTIGANNSKVEIKSTKAATVGLPGQIISNTTKQSSKANHVQKLRKKTVPSGPIVRLRKKSLRHADCRKAALPKFQFEKDSDENDDASDNINANGESPASYGTTSWIKNMVKWRIQRNQHLETTLTNCGCPDCSSELKDIREKKALSSK
jgi:hypothetical protein